MNAEIVLPDTSEEFKGTKRFLRVLFGGLAFIIFSQLAVLLSAYFAFWSVLTILGPPLSGLVLDPIIVIGMTVWIILGFCVIAFLLIATHWVLPVRLTEIHDGIVMSAGLLLVLFPVLPISWSSSEIILGSSLNYWFFLPSIGLSLLVTTWIQEHDEHPNEFRHSALPFVFIIGLMSSILSGFSIIETPLIPLGLTFFTFVNLSSSLSITVSALFFTKMSDELGI